MSTSYKVFMKKDKPESGSPRHIAGNNLFMLKIAWKTAPEVIFALLISSIFSNIMSFVLNVWLLRQIINGFQAGISMFGLIVAVIALNGVFVIYNIISNAYYEIRYPIIQLKISEYLQKMIFKKSGEVELACYEDKKFYDEFIKSASELNNRFWQVIDSLTGLVSFLLSLSLNALFVLTIDPLLLYSQYSPRSSLSF